jgi:hypothetical protein
MYRHRIMKYDFVISQVNRYSLLSMLVSILELPETYEEENSVKLVLNCSMFRRNLQLHAL